MQTLTLEEIKNMPSGAEMDKLIHKAYFTDVPDFFPVRTLWGIFNSARTGFYDIRENEDDARRQLENSKALQEEGAVVESFQKYPYWSDDIDMAWRLLEHIANKYECSTAVGREYPYGRWTYCALVRGGKLAYSTPDLKAYALAHKASLAIGRLALMIANELV